MRYRGLEKAHAWYVLLAIAYNLKKLPKLFVESLIKQKMRFVNKEPVEKYQKMGRDLAFLNGNS